MISRQPQSYALDLKPRTNQTDKCQTQSASVHKRGQERRVRPTAHSLGVTSFYVTLTFLMAQNPCALPSESTQLIAVWLYVPVSECSRCFRPVNPADTLPGPHVGGHRNTGQRSPTLSTHRDRWGRVWGESEGRQVGPPDGST